MEIRRGVDEQHHYENKKAPTKLPLSFARLSTIYIEIEIAGEPPRPPARHPALAVNFLKFGQED